MTVVGHTVVAGGVTFPVTFAAGKALGLRQAYVRVSLSRGRTVTYVVQGAVPLSSSSSSSSQPHARFGVAGEVLQAPSTAPWRQLRITHGSAAVDTDGVVPTQVQGPAVVLEGFPASDVHAAAAQAADADGAWQVFVRSDRDGTAAVMARPQPTGNVHPAHSASAYTTLLYSAMVNNTGRYVELSCVEGKRVAFAYFWHPCATTVTAL